MKEDLGIRPATADDIPEIVRQRRLMFEDMRVGELDSLDRMEKASLSYLQQTMAQGAYLGWLAMDGSREIAGGVGILLQSSPPRPWEVQHRRAYLLNLYVYPKHRRRGIARRLVETSVGWCREEGYATVSLHASEVGRNLYASLGFQPTNEMRLKLR